MALLLAPTAASMSTHAGTVPTAVAWRVLRCWYRVGADDDQIPTKWAGMVTEPPETTFAPMNCKRGDNPTAVVPTQV